MLPQSARRRRRRSPGTASDAEIVPDGFTSEALLDDERLSGDLRGRRVWIVRSQTGRELLGRTLASRGADVHYLASYERKAPALDAASRDSLLERWSAGGIDAVTALSAETLKNLEQLLGTDGVALLERTPLVTASQGVLKTLRERNFSAPLGLADGPDADAIVAALADTLDTVDHGTKMSESSNDSVAPMPDSTDEAPVAEPDNAPERAPRQRSMAPAWLALALSDRGACAQRDAALAVDLAR